MSENTSPNRRYLTDWMRDVLRAGGLKADVSVAPEDGGWNDDPRQPESFFEPYTVIFPLASAASAGAISDLGQLWDLPYALVSYAVGAASIEDQMDTARRIVHEASKTVVDLGGVSWKVMSTMTNSIGAMEINYQVEPAQYSQRDVVLLRITKAMQ